MENALLQIQYLIKSPAIAALVDITYTHSNALTQLSMEPTYQIVSSPVLLQIFFSIAKLNCLDVVSARITKTN